MVSTTAPAKLGDTPPRAWPVEAWCVRDRAPYGRPPGQCAPSTASNDPGVAGSGRGRGRITPERCRHGVGRPATTGYSNGVSDPVPLGWTKLTHIALFPR